MKFKYGLFLGSLFSRGKMNQVRRKIKTLTEIIKSDQKRFGGTMKWSSRKTRIGVDVRTGEPVYFSESERKIHMQMIGASRRGKSKALEYILRQDILAENAGICLIDPHGTLYNEMLNLIAHDYSYLAERVVLFNPSESKNDGYTVPMNLIPDIYEENIDLSYVVGSLVNACLLGFGQTDPNETPRIQRLLTDLFNIIVANRLTLADAGAILLDDQQRKFLLEKVPRHTRLNWERFSRLSFINSYR